MTWVLIVTWEVSAAYYPPGMYDRSSVYSSAVAFQEFNTLQACQFASVEAQKLMPSAHKTRVACVPKGETK
jgi:hypothetical protein